MRPTMAGRNVKRLYDLEIDEISLVDRSANQHADVAIAKRDEDSMSKLIDAEGYKVEQDELTPGEPVWNEDGSFAGIACEEGMEPSDYGIDFDAETGEPFLLEENEPELVGVGKGFGEGAARFARSKGLEGAMKSRAAIGRRPIGAVAAGAGAGALGGAAAKQRMSKGLGSSVYEELSKALNDDARSQVVSKALEDAYSQVDEARTLAYEAVEVAKSLRDQLETERLTAHTQGYGIGDAGQLADIIKSLDPRQARYLDQVLTSAGDAVFSELGSGLGQSETSVLGQVEALANQAVTKANVSAEQAMTELFAANPDAYDEYLAESY